MERYLERVLHQQVKQIPYHQQKKLPLGCRNAFELHLVQIGQAEFLLATPVEQMNLTELRKMRLQLERYTGYPCVFALEQVNWYASEKMIEEGIPFVWKGHQTYLPFLGVLLKEQEIRVPKPCAVISFLTQKLLLKALYEQWKNVSATQAAELLQVSRMSITRCYDEIEAFGLPFLKKQGRMRKFTAMPDKREMWETMRSFLRRPVIRTFRLEKVPSADMAFSGLSALSAYSMLGEDDCRTYAVGKTQISALGIKEIREVPANEEPACVIHEVGYLLPFGDEHSVDPLSLTMILTEEEKEDPRVESCVAEMLEELVW